MQQTEHFYRLTPDEIIDALVKLGLEPSGHVAQLNSMENRVFDLRLENGQHVVTKFYRPGRWNRAQILEEHSFLLELAAAEVPALAPLQFGGETLFIENGIYFALWPRTGGREPEELSDVDLQILGRLLARVHNVGAARAMPTRPSFTIEKFIHEPLALLQREKFLKEPFLEHYTTTATKIAAKFEIHREHLPMIRIHGDLHKGNILNGSEGWFLLDFDDALVGPAVQDIWMLFPGNDQAACNARAICLEAYREFREFDERWLELAETLRGMRIIHYSGWIARRYDDPSFPATFPDFASNAYWEEELGILEDICATFSDGQKDVTQPSQLSDKDYFFDMQD